MDNLLIINYGDSDFAKPAEKMAEYINDEIGLIGIHALNDRNILEEEIERLWRMYSFLYTANYGGEFANSEKDFYTEQEIKRCSDYFCLKGKVELTFDADLNPNNGETIIIDLEEKKYKVL